MSYLAYLTPYTFHSPLGLTPDSISAPSLVRSKFFEFLWASLPYDFIKIFYIFLDFMITSVGYQGLYDWLTLRYLTRILMILSLW